MEVGRDVLKASYWIRTQDRDGEESVTVDEADGLRRLDYLGSNYIFRGLEPAPDGEGFILFMGAP